MGRKAVALRRDEIERNDATAAIPEARYVRGEDRFTIEWPDGSKVHRIIYRPRGFVAQIV